MKFIHVLCLTLALLGITHFLSAQTPASGTNSAAQTAPDQSQYPRLPFIGVLPVDLTEGRMSKLGFANPHGVMVQDVDESGPAFQAGLQKGDIIRGVDGHGTPAVSALNAIISSRVPGDTVTLDVWRSGHAVSIKLAIGDAGVSCTRGDAWACGNIGVAYANGMGVAKDEAHAVLLFQQACDAGFVGDCYNLGVMVHNGTGVPKDEPRAVALFKQACDGGFATGCFNLGVMYANGTGVSKDETRALQFFKQACDGGEALGCNITK